MNIQMKVDHDVKDRPLIHWIRRVMNRKNVDSYRKQSDDDTLFAPDTLLDSRPFSERQGGAVLNLNSGVSGLNNDAVNEDNSNIICREEYSPEAILESIKGIGNPDIVKELQTIMPVDWKMSMPDLLEVFRQYPQVTFFPIIDEDNHPRGIIREVNLKEFVYSRFGATLLENPNFKDKLSDFIEPCTIVDIHDKNEDILQTFSDSATTEGVIVTKDSRYLGVISLRSLIKLGHERELSLRESHNRILQQRNNDINNILRNMKQGIFTILEDGTIHHDYSAYLETIFETNHIEGRHYLDLLFQSSNLEKDKLSQTKSTVENSLGEDTLSFEVNSHLLVEEYQLRFEDGRIKHIELFWNPVEDEDDIVKRIIVNVRDKTEIVKLQEAASQQQREFNIISQVISISYDTFEEFIKSTSEYIDTCFQLLEKHNSFDQSVIAHIFRNLHTIKGNSRLYGFDDFTNIVHDVEGIVNRFRSREISYNPRKMKRELSRVRHSLDEYSTVITKKLGGFLKSRQKGVFLDDQLFCSLSDMILNENCDDLLDSVQTIVKSKKILSAVNTVSLSSIFQEIHSSLNSMAAIVGKPKPNIYINSNKIRLTREISPVLNIAIIHSIRNSLSHGIEKEEDRKEQGKTPNGNIYLVAKLTEEKFSIEYWDDGSGLDLLKIMNRARETGLIKVNKPLGARQIAEFIFCPGLSTASGVTEIAGRGVGMDAILKAVKNIGGSMDIVLQPLKVKKQAKRPFKFVFEFPPEYALEID